MRIKNFQDTILGLTLDLWYTVGFGSSGFSKSENLFAAIIKNLIIILKSRSNVSRQFITLYIATILIKLACSWLYFNFFSQSQLHNFIFLGRISFKDPDENDEEIAHLQFNSSVGETEAFELSKIGR